MKYADGTDIEPGDLVRIEQLYRGRVIACMDNHRYLPGADEWAYLGRGIMVHTDFAGLVYYTDDNTDELELIRREGGAQASES